jgi:hypothetical protein
MCQVLDRLCNRAFQTRLLGTRFKARNCVSEPGPLITYFFKRPVVFNIAGGIMMCCD